MTAVETWASKLPRAPLQREPPLRTSSIPLATLRGPGRIPPLTQPAWAALDSRSDSGRSSFVQRAQLWSPSARGPPPLKAPTLESPRLARPLQDSAEPASSCFPPSGPPRHQRPPGAPSSPTPPRSPPQPAPWGRPPMLLPTSSVPLPFVCSSLLQNCLIA